MSEVTKIEADIKAVEQKVVKTTEEVLSDIKTDVGKVVARVESLEGRADAIEQKVSAFITTEVKNIVNDIKKDYAQVTYHVTMLEQKAKAEEQKIIDGAKADESKLIPKIKSALISVEMFPAKVTLKIIQVCITPFVKLVGLIKNYIDKKQAQKTLLDIPVEVDTSKVK